VSGTCEIDEARAQRVLAEYVAGALADELALHPRVGVFLKPLVLAGHHAVVGETLLLQLPHLRLDLLEVFRGKWRIALKIVVKTGVGGRPYAELRFRKQLEYGCGEQMRGRVPVDFKRLRIPRRENLQLGVALERPREVVEVAIDAGDDRVVRKPRTDLFRDIERTGARRNLLLAAIRQSDGDAHLGLIFQRSIDLWCPLHRWNRGAT
jgi:hypothetical protein